MELDEDDEIPMSELEDLMDEITLEEEIDDEISIKQVHELTNNVTAANNNTNNRHNHQNTLN